MSHIVQNIYLHNKWLFENILIKWVVLLRQLTKLPLFSANTLFYKNQENFVPPGVFLIFQHHCSCFALIAHLQPHCSYKIVLVKKVGVSAASLVS